MNIVVSSQNCKTLPQVPALPLHGDHGQSHRPRLRRRLAHGEAAVHHDGGAARPGPRAAAAPDAQVRALRQLSATVRAEHAAATATKNIYYDTVSKDTIFGEGSNCEIFLMIFLIFPTKLCMPCIWFQCLASKVTTRQVSAASRAELAAVPHPPAAGKAAARPRPRPRPPGPRAQQ